MQYLPCRMTNLIGKRTCFILMPDLNLENCKGSYSVWFLTNADWARSEGYWNGKLPLTTVRFGLGFLPFKCAFLPPPPCSHFLMLHPLVNQKVKFLPGWRSLQKDCASLKSSFSSGLRACVTQQRGDFHRNFQICSFTTISVAIDYCYKPGMAH